MNKVGEGVAHSILYLGLVVGAAAIYMARSDPARQIIIVLILVVFYLVWGFSYHNARGDLKRKTMLEYMAISLISLLVAFIVFVS